MSKAHQNAQWKALAKRRVTMGRNNDEPCASCGSSIDYTLSGAHQKGPTADHPDPLAWGGELLPPIETLNVVHRICAQRQGGRVRNAQRRRSQNRPQPAPSVLSGPPAHSARSDEVCLSTSREVPYTLSASPRDPGESDGLPRYFSPPHPEAVGSLGDEMVAHAEERRGGSLRWFQWVTAQRRYEVRADGTWCWPLVFESAPRQQGKSVTLSEDAAWYSSRTTEPELLLHTAYRVKTSLKVQSGLWNWAEKQGMDVRRLLGDSHILWPNGTDWATVALESTYGIPAHRLLVDEAWAMDPTKFWNSIFPTLGDRENAQVLFWSTANPEDHGLVSDLRKDPEVCRMEWGALPGEDPLDPAVWKASSAYWGPGRERLMRTASSRPGFEAEWLNTWPSLAKGVSLTPFPNWGSLPVIDGEPPYGALVALDEHVDGGGASVAALHDNQYWYREVGNLRDAVDQAKQWTSSEVLVGYSLKAAVDGMGLPHAIPFGARETGLGTPLLLEAVRDGRISHEHREDVERQFEGMRTRTNDAGVTSLSVRDSREPVISGKLLAWMLYQERSRVREMAAIW